MTMLGNSLIGIGALASLIGISGFMDTRKVDRRFKTGYKNNAPDTRNFGRASKILLCGIGIFLVGLLVNRLFNSDVEPVQSSPIRNEANSEERATAQTTPAPTVSESRDTPAPEVQTSAPSESHMADTDHRSPEISTTSNDAPEAPATGAVPDPTFATSFDCSRASQGDESAICHDPGLAAMDRRLAQLYSAALRTISDPETLRQSESDWVAARHQCGQDLNCLRHAYGERIGQFTDSLGSQPLVPEKSN
ncbi:lysozyme inhibitor LprI family protein [Burkholderia plantarii]|uniref:lysozyme inhibitor LprI family protein n=1 Tax=Burkholderia plantarii TaxID=41899 RepID=UPI000706B5BE|nr:lysozyme inhibitor LprI family protein [Burkholderia plantarii]ALK32318.1 lipoprotein-like protein [Burkholderia plantarii]GLZ18854.1 hypothetical protein Bpla01_23840 [Burkholderia plantarii]